MRIQKMFCALLAALMLLSAVSLAETALPADDYELAAFSEDEMIAAVEAEGVEEVPAELPSFDLGDPGEDGVPVDTVEPVLETDPAVEAEPAVDEPEAEPAPETEGPAPESDSADAGTPADVVTEPDEVEAEPAAGTPSDIVEADDLAVETLPEKIEIARQSGILTEAAPVQATGLTAKKLSLIVGKGENAALNVTAQPAGAILGTLTYVSYKPKVASVSADGHVRGVKKGNRHHRHLRYRAEADPQRAGDERPPGRSS